MVSHCLVTEMCLSPLSIKNPNYGLKHLEGLKDITSQYIRVPCGYCSQCIAVKQMGYVQRIQMEAIYNHLFFCTLTYSDDTLPTLLTSSGYEIRFADVSDVQKMFKRIRKLNPVGRTIRYFGVSEFGSKRGRPHFHLVLAVEKCPKDDFNICLWLENVLFKTFLNEWRRNVGTNRSPVYLPLCHFVRRFIRGRIVQNFDLHYVNPGLTSNGEADVAFYVLKYMLKPSDRAVKLQQALHLNLSEEEYLSTWKVVRPRVFFSKGFGFDSRKGDDGKFHHNYQLIQRLRKSVHLRDSDGFPVFVNPVSGALFPLSRYYRNSEEVYSAKDKVQTYFASKDVNPIDRDLSYSQLLTKLKKDEKILHQVDCTYGASDDFGSLCSSEHDSCEGH